MVRPKVVAFLFLLQGLVLSTSELDAADSMALRGRARRGRARSLATIGSFTLSSSNRAGNDEVQEQDTDLGQVLDHQDDIVKFNCQGTWACRGHLSTCPAGKRCKLLCQGYWSCRGAKLAGTGTFVEVICNGVNACQGLNAGSAFFTKMTCQGQWACSTAVPPICPPNQQCELVCRPGGCAGARSGDRLGTLKLGAPGSVVDIVNSGILSYSSLPNPTSLSREMLAFRVVGVKTYTWPPKCCNVTGTTHQGTDSKKLWYCPKTQKCVPSARECMQEATLRPLGVSEIHDATLHQHHVVSVSTRTATKSVSGLVGGKTCTRSGVPIKVMEEAQAGYQATSALQLGALRTLAGTVVNVDTSVNIFKLTKPMRPNYCIRVLSPLIKKGSVQAIVLELCDDGRAQVTLPNGVTSTHSTLSLAGVKFVPWEVKGGVKFPSDWSDAKGSYRYYHKLDMGGGVMCVLSGTIKTKWGSSATAAVGQIDRECTKGYKEGYRAIANVKVDGEQQWMEQGKAGHNTVSFQLFLHGTDNSELSIWTSRTDLVGKSVTLSLDGTTFASGEAPKAPEACQAEESENGDLEHESENSDLEHESENSDLEQDFQRAVANNSSPSAGDAQGHSFSAQEAPTVNETRNIWQGCTLVKNRIDTAQPGFAPSSVLGTANVAIMGDDIVLRTCVLRGVVRFTSIDGDAIAFLDPNYRDSISGMPFCFPIATTIFFGGIVEQENPAEIVRTVAIQIEPHGRLLISGEEKDLSVRLDNIMFHPLMRFNPYRENDPYNCGPYCFPAGKLGSEEMAMAGCVKYCTPTQYIRRNTGELAVGTCQCTLLKRLICFKRKIADPGREAPMVCEQFKKLMGKSTMDPDTRNAEPDSGNACGQICAGQLTAF